MSGVVGELTEPRPARENTVSPVELLKIFLDNSMDPAIVPAGSVVGGADDDEQQAGVVALMDAGDQDIDDAPVLWKRIQVRCMGPDLDVADRVGRHVADLLEYQDRLLITDSEDRTWLVYQIRTVVGMSHHFDSSETLEGLMFVVIGVGQDPVGVDS